MGQVMLWSDILYGIILSLALVSNLVLLVSLLKYPMKSFLTNHLMRIQCILDLIISASVIFVTFSGNVDFTVNVFVCIFLKSQMPTWLSLCGSTMNQILLAVDRYLAICRATTYRQKYKMKMALFIVLLLVYPNLITSSQYTLWWYENSTCINEERIAGTLLLAATVWFVGELWLPTAVYLLVYGTVVLSLTRQQRQVAVSSSNTRASKTTSGSIRFTKICMLLAVVNFVCVGVDAFYTQLWAMGYVVYEYGGPIQVFGVTLIASSSLVNPIVYFVFLPSMRARVKNFYRKIVHRRADQPNLDLQMSTSL